MTPTGADVAGIVIPRRARTGATFAEFDDFYRASFQWVLRAVFVYSGDRETARDATQEAFSKALVRWRSVKRHDSPRGWVLVTAINLTKRAARLESRLRSLRPPPATESRVAPDERIDAVTALRTIPSRQRQAAVLHYVADYPIAVVAELMGISEGAVKAHLAWARKALRQRLATHGDDRP